MIPVIFLLDADYEAVATRRFWSKTCRDCWTVNEFEIDFAITRYSFEETTGVEGEVCETCGKTINENEAT